MITKRSISKPNSIEEFGEIAISKKKPKFPLLASTIQFSNHHAPHDPTSHPGPATTHGHRTAPQKTRGVAVREPKSAVSVIVHLSPLESLNQILKHF